ncbi:helix-turn-helix domain-containing protein [Curtobacterium sp. VKM Ac-1376]|nr:helix-turn-helix domain-containing protein [Curtobacterium sp. VKM Ac-1376]
MFAQAVTAAFVPLRVERPQHGAFWGRLRSGRAADLSVTEVVAQPHRVVREPEGVPNEVDGSYKLSLLLAGRAIIAQDGREAVLSPGDLTLYETNRPYLLETDEPFSMVVLMFPRRGLGLPRHRVDELTAVRMGGEAGVADLVRPFVARLPMHLADLDGPAGVRIAHSTVELVSTLVAERAGPSPDPRRELVERCKRWMEDRLSHPDLAPGSVAAAHFVSTRQLHALFHEQGETVSGWLRGRRLERCRADLLDPALSNQPVAAIASHWGFVDPTHFSRLFRATYGCPPRSLRTRPA